MALVIQGTAVTAQQERQQAAHTTNGTVFRTVLK